MAKTYVMAPTTFPETHNAVVTVAKGAPLELLSVSTVPPTDHEIVVRISWVSATPLNLHRADGGLLANYPQILGGGFTGTIVAQGPEDCTSLKIGDHVFGFSWLTPQQLPWQEFITIPETLAGKIPENFKDVKALCTVPDSLVTAWHTTRIVLGMDIPWPKQEEWKPKDADAPVLVWGGSSSVGSFVLQLLKWAGYTHIVTTASKQHHDALKDAGATETFDYREHDIVQKLKDAAGATDYKYVVDCIGSLNGSVKPLAEIAQDGSKVGIMLPVIIKDGAKGVEPILAMEVGEEIGVQWKPGVSAVGVRTHHYMEVNSPK